MSHTKPARGWWMSKITLKADQALCALGTVYHFIVSYSSSLAGSSFPDFSSPQHTLQRGFPAAINPAWGGLVVGKLWKKKGWSNCLPDGESWLPVVHLLQLWVWLNCTWLWGDCEPKHWKLINRRLCIASIYTGTAQALILHHTLSFWIVSLVSGWGHWI